MENTKILPVAIANLRSSQSFLGKLLAVCEQIKSAETKPSDLHTVDQESLRAITLLAKMTEAILMQAEYCNQNGGSFSAHQTLADVINDADENATQTRTLDKAEGTADVGRMRVVMEMCLQQGKSYRRQAFMLGTELATLKSTLKEVYQDLTSAQAELDPR